MSRSDRQRRKCEICCEYLKSSKKENPENDWRSSFYAHFPKEENRCKEWLRLVGNEELVFLPVEKLYTTRFICGKHFLLKHFNKRRNRLKKRATPSLHLSSPPLTNEQMSSFPQHIYKDPVSEEKNMPCTSASSIDPVVKNSGKRNLEHCDPVQNKKSKKEDTPHPSIKSVEKSDPVSEAKNMPCTSASSAIDPVRTVVKKRGKRHLEHCELTPRKKKLMVRLRRTKCTLASLRKSASIIEKIESPFLKEMVEATTKNQGRKLQGRRWTTQNKISALAIMKRSPKAYRYLRHLIPLPSVKTLQNILRRVPMEPGINKAVLQHFSAVAKDRNIKEKMVCLLFDEMALKSRLILNLNTDQVDGYEDMGKSEDGSGRNNKLADHVLVFMVQGLYRKFKQPLAFYFVKGTISSQKLAALIKEIIRAISATGFKVVNTVCDQGSTNMGALKQLRDFSGPSEQLLENAFLVDNEKVYIVYDIPHLFKNIRNNFQKNGIVTLNGKKGKWSHLRLVEEKNRSFLYLSKISPVHVDPKYRAKMKVKYAAQILSTTVAAVLKLLSQAEREQTVAAELMETAEVVQEFDRLFDITNGPSAPEDIKKGIRENVSSKTNHLNVWTASMKKIESIKFYDSAGVEARNVKCTNGFLISLKSLRDIWSTVKNAGFKHLNLRQLNQDALENLFGVIRQHSPTNKHPTCAHFMAALKTSIISGLSAPQSRGANCENDKNIIMTNFHNFVFDKKEEKEPEIATETLDIATETPDARDECLSQSDFPLLSLPDNELDWTEMESNFNEVADQPVVYISGYIVSRIKQNLKCEECKKNLIVEEAEHDDPMFSYIKLREWWQDKASLTYPTKNVCRLVQCATKLTEEHICDRLHERNICQTTLTLYWAQCDTKWFSCTEHSSQIFSSIFTRLALLLLRRQCHIINQGLSLREENLADATKKAQQSGMAK